MMKITLNRLKPQAEKIIAEEQAGFRAGRSTTEQIFNLRILCEKYLQHQQDLYHVYIDIKGSGRVLWTYSGRKTLPPSTSLPVMGEIAGVNTALLGGYFHNTKTRDRRKGSTNSTATCLTWRGMGSARLCFA